MLLKKSGLVHPFQLIVSARKWLVSFFFYLVCVAFLFKAL